MRNPDLSPNPSTGKTRGNGHDEPGGFELPEPSGDEDRRQGGKLEDDARAVLKLEPQFFRDLVHEIILRARHAGLPIYKHGPYLCRPAIESRTRWDGQEVTVGILSNYSPATLRQTLEEAMLFVKYDARAKGWKPTPCPDELVDRLLGHAEDNAFPTIRGLLQTPILRPDMKLVVRPGYDPVTSYFLIDTPPLPEMDLSREGAKRALDKLKDLISEFPFATDRDRAVALSGLITPLVRAACDVVPGHLFTAPTQGSGKSLLVNLAAAIATGQPAYATLAHERQEETDKQLTASVIEGRQIIALDNVTGDIRSPVLAQIMEQANVLARPLGTSNQIPVENAYCAYITGNNSRPAGDNTRRLLVGRIDSQHENPIDRIFEKEHPLLRVAAARGEYIADCLTIVLAYQHACAEGEARPAELPPLPSYGRWSMLVREPLVWLDMPDPVESIRDSFNQDPGVTALGALITAVQMASLPPEWTASELIRNADQGNHDLTEALLPIATGRRGTLDASKLGWFLRSNHGRVVNGLRIERAGQDRLNVARWKVAATA